MAPPPERQVLAGGTWEYVGQAIFPLNRDPSGTQAPLVPDNRPSGPSTKVDRHGRKWVRVGPGHGDSLVIGRAPIRSGDGVSSFEYHGDGGEEGGLRLASWATDCGTSNTEHAIESTEDRVLITNYESFAARKANVIVFLHHIITVGPPWDQELVSALWGTCTGTMLDTDYVLTAGHCVAPDQNGTPTEWDPDFMMVCTNGNLDTQNADVECSRVDDVAAKPAYLSGGSATNDVGVITLVDSIVDADETMALSASGTSTWDDFLMRNMAYHAYQTGFSGADPTCANNSLASEETSYTESPWTLNLLGRNLHRDTRSEHIYSTNLVKTKFDGANGASGSAFFICPNSEDCDDEPEVIGVFAVYLGGVANRHRGPRVNTFKTWVENNAP